jgi:hypothetical protein
MRKILPFLSIICPALLLFTGFFHPITAFTQDLGRHILLGKIILQTKSVPKTNLFSYTYPDFPFINHHFFSEIIFYLTDTFFGIPGFFILLLGLIFATSGIILTHSLRQYKKPLITSFVALLYLRILFERTDVRPELFSFFFFSLFIVILFTYRLRFTKWIILLVPLQLIWVNSHIYFPLGILLLLLFFIDHCISHSRSLLNKKTTVFLFILFLSGITVFINPNGITGALYPLRVFENYGYAIEENQTIFFLEQLFYKPTIVYFKLAVGIVFLSLLLTIKKTRPIDWLLAITFTILGAQAVRNFPLFVFATFIPLIHAVSYISTFITETYPIIKKHSTRISMLFFLIVLTSWHIHDITEQKEFGYGVAPGAERAAAFFKTQNIKGPVFNNFDIGSYFTSVMYPKERVFVDGRPEAYPKDFFTTVYIPMQQNEKVFGIVEKQYNFQSIFFSHTDQTPWAETFVKSILKNPTWVPVYLDDTVIILVKDSPINEKISTHFGMNISTLHAQSYNSTDLSSLFKLARFYNLISATEQEISFYHHILKLKPTHCPSLYNLGRIYADKQNPAASIYINKFYTSCH